MPAHRTHELVGNVSTPLVFTGTFQYTQDVTVACIVTGLYIFSTYFLSPDLDIDSAPYHRWGFLTILWYPYKTLIHHRSWLSHSGPISGTIRFLYLVTILTIVGMFTPLTLTPYYGMLLVAMILADSLHTLLDLIWKG